MPELVIQISEKANRLLEAYKESTGLGDNARVVEEALYTIYELLKLEKERSKTEPTVPASEFIGAIATFRRFGDPKVEFKY